MLENYPAMNLKLVLISSWRYLSSLFANEEEVLFVEAPCQGCIQGVIFDESVGFIKRADEQ
jgi:hypothetical protein